MNKLCVRINSTLSEVAVFCAVFRSLAQSFLLSLLCFVVSRSRSSGFIHAMDVVSLCFVESPLFVCVIWCVKCASFNQSSCSHNGSCYLSCFCVSPFVRLSDMVCEVCFVQSIFLFASCSYSRALVCLLRSFVGVILRSINLFVRVVFIFSGAIFVRVWMCASFI